MWKKIFSIALLLSVAVCASVSAAVRNPANDPNLVLFYQHQGLESYFFGDSLRVKEKNSLKFISFKFMVYDSIQPKNTRWDKKISMTFAYDESTRKVYFVDEKGGLTFLNPNGTVAEGSGYAMGAEIIYYTVTAKRFYGTYDDEFYEKIAVG